jgi:hypothetical protein
VWQSIGDCLPEANRTDVWLGWGQKGGIWGSEESRPWPPLDSFPAFSIIPNGVGHSATPDGNSQATLFFLLFRALPASKRSISKSGNIGSKTLSTDITSTIIPWLLGGLAGLTALSLTLTTYSWRESKRSPYYFLRRQAEQQMQSYSLITVVLLVGMLFVGTYAWQAPQDSTVRMVQIDNAKPVLLSNSQQDSEMVSLTNPVTGNGLASNTAVPEAVVLRGNSTEELYQASLRTLTDLQMSGEPLGLDLDTTTDNITNTLSLTTTNALPPTATQTLALPPEYAGLRWSSELSDDTIITPLVFSDVVDDDLQPLNPSRLYQQGFFTIYATFAYEGMADGLSWSWVWRRDGQPISGGHELWSYGDEGPGYVYLAPPEGFSPGQYTVEIWVNETLMTQGNLFVTTDAAAANN